MEAGGGEVRVEVWEQKLQLDTWYFEKFITLSLVDPTNLDQCLMRPKSKIKICFNTSKQQKCMNQRKWSIGISKWLCKWSFFIISNKIQIQHNCAQRAHCYLSMSFQLLPPTLQGWHLWNEPEVCHPHLVATCTRSQKGRGPSRGYSQYLLGNCFTFYGAKDRFANQSWSHVHKASHSEKTWLAPNPLVQ